MSPIKRLQEKYRELGRLRMGHQVPTSSGKTRPEKLASWRLTSPSLPLLESVAAVYGGEPRQWEGAPTEGPQYEVMTTSDHLRVVIPPGDVLSQWMELWSGGGIQRRCDGETRADVDRPCSCPIGDRKIADEAERMTKMRDAKAGTVCVPVTRFALVLPEIPDLGVWRLETHSWNGAEEIRTVYDLMRENVPEGVAMPARLRIDQRTRKADGKTSHFTVPVIEFYDRAIDMGEGFALPEGEAQGEPSRFIPPIERKSLPGAPPPVSTDGPSVEPASFPGAPPETWTPPPLPAWIMDLPGTEAEIIAAAIEVAKQAGKTIAPWNLYDLSQIPISEEPQQAIRELLQNPTSGADGHQEPSEPAEASVEQGTLA